MTIKKQFIILGLLITVIPLLCACFIYIYQSVNSPKHLLVNGTDEIKKINSNSYSGDDITKIKNILSRYPENVELIILDENLNILASNLKKITLPDHLDPVKLFKFINKTAPKYFYQFTTLELEKNTITFISRIPYDNSVKRQPAQFIFYLIIFLFIFVLILIAILFLIFNNITKSIIMLEQTTHQIANGDFSTPTTNISPNRTTNEIMKINHSLEKMKISLIEAQTRKNKFIMGISHDLRTPISIITGYIEALNDGIITDPEEISQTLDLIQVKTNQLESMIDTLINFVRLEKDEIQEKMSCQSINDLINDFVNEAKISSGVFKRKIISEIDLPEKLYTPYNKQLVNRAFENLFGNALRYTQTDDEITFNAFYKDEKVYFKISDTGCGISEEDLPNIFDMFYRASSSRREEGFGIGLAVVKNIIHTHGWKISVESKINEGSCFTIEIPLEKEGSN